MNQQEYGIDFERIKELVDKYDNDKKSGKIKRMTETDTRDDFITPLFKALGWNMENRLNRNDSVSKEENIAGKRSDYGFRINDILKFFVEAKSIKEEDIVFGPGYDKQVVNYAWLKSCSWGVLTNFSQLAVYNADRGSPAWAFTLIAKDYLSENGMEKLNFLSKKGFEMGLLDKWASENGKKPMKRPVDKQLLQDMIQFREILSSDIKKNNPSIHPEDIDETVQRTLDRLVFIRNAEDREYESRELNTINNQWSRLEKGQLIKKVRGLYQRYREIYNSGLFGKEDETIHISDQVEISNDALGKVIGGLYSPEGADYSYNFSILDTDVLGKIYEQYLGNLLKQTPKRAKLESSKIHRKEQGIYYTPSYIVDYIVKNTVGEYIKTHSPEEIRYVRILDPACGSGSFLIRAYKELENYWNDYYSKNKTLPKSARNVMQTKFETNNEESIPEFYSTKTEILKNNIFGVDLDPKAVEIAQLNLLLQISERKHRLPLLQSNIKVGNSLIDDPAVSDRAFKWEEGFPAMKEGGFDIIIGNPPYINIKLLTRTNTSEKEFYQSNYDVVYGSYDIYTLFIEKAVKLLKAGGLLGFIVPNKFTVTEYGLKLRKFILDNCLIEKIVDVSPLPVFKGVGTYPIILIIKKESVEEKRNQNKIEFLNAKNERDLTNGKKTIQIKQNSYIENNTNIFTFNLSSGSNKVLDKLKEKSSPLGDIAVVNCGTTGFEYKNWGRLITDNIEKGEDSLPFIITGNIDHYALNHNKPVHYQGRKLTSAYFKKSKDVTEGKWALFSSKKIVVRGMALELTAAYDDIGCACGVSVYTIKEPKEDIDMFYLLAILNSKLIDYFYKSQFISKHLAGKYIGYNKGQIEQIPIRSAPKKEQELIVQLVEKLIKLTKRLNQLHNTDEYENLRSEINNIDIKVNDLVYKIYGITNSERKIIEESL